MMNILYENFTPIIHAKYITAVICARHETLDSAKLSVNNFFAINFNRSEKIESVPVDLVLKKRLENSSENRIIQRKLVNSYFTESFCILMSKLQNGNIRKSLSIFEHIMSVLPPFTGKEATEKYTNFLLEYDYFDDLFVKLNPSDNLPVIKIVFDALQYQAIVNKKFYDVIISKILIQTRNAIGISESNIEVAIEFLKKRSLISDAFDISNRFILTPKGETYKKIIITKPYTDRFCKTANDKLY